MRFLYIFSLILLLNACGKKSAQQAGGARPVAVKYSAAYYGTIAQSFETVGELKADREVQVAAERAGQLEYIYVREGSWVNEGQVLAKIKGEDASAELDQAQNDYSSFKSLYEQGAISYQELLKYQTNLKKAESTISNLEIRSRISGVVGQIYVDPGDFVNLGTLIMDVVKNRPLRVSYNIPEKAIPLVKQGDIVEITSDAEPTKTIKAYVDFISPRVDPKSRAVLVRARIDDSMAANLKANQFVKVKQALAKATKTILVPETAIYLDQGQEYVYIAVENKEDRSSFKNGKQVKAIGQIAQRIPIKVGLRDDEGQVEIIEGVNNGDLVIYAGLHSIYPGATLAPVEETEPSSLEHKTKVAN